MNVGREAQLKIHPLSLLQLVSPEGSLGFRRTRRVIHEGREWSNYLWSGIRRQSLLKRRRKTCLLLQIQSSQSHACMCVRERESERHASSPLLGGGIRRGREARRWPGSRISTRRGARAALARAGRVNADEFLHKFHFVLLLLEAFSMAAPSAGIWESLSQYLGICWPALR